MSPSPEDRTASLEPWPLATEARLRAIAWPDYASEDELRRVLHVVEPLWGRADACLLLRHDEALDGPLDAAVEAVRRALSAFDRRGDLDVLFVDDPIPRADWPRVGVGAFCAILSGAAGAQERAEFIRAQPAELVDARG